MTIEKIYDRRIPEVFLESLFNTAGVTAQGVIEARRASEDGEDPIEQAKSTAEKGLIGEALQHVRASNLSTYHQIWQTYRLAQTAMGFFEGMDDLSSEQQDLRSRAKAVYEATGKRIDISFDDHK